MLITHHPSGLCLCALVGRFVQSRTCSYTPWPRNTVNRPNTSAFSAIRNNNWGVDVVTAVWLSQQVLRLLWDAGNCTSVCTFSLTERSLEVLLPGTPETLEVCMRQPRTRVFGFLRGATCPAGTLVGSRHCGTVGRDAVDMCCCDGDKWVTARRNATQSVAKGMLTSSSFLHADLREWAASQSSSRAAL